MNNAQIADILEALAQAVRSNNSVATDLIGRRLENMGARSVKAKPTKSAAKGSVKVDRKLINSMLRQLTSANDRDAGFRILRNQNLTRVELVALAKDGDVHVTKADNIGKIEEKLVEELIGSRLSSAAIRGGASIARYR